MKLWRFPLFAATAGLAALLPTPALAHPVNTQIEDFYAGMMHPLTSIEHLLPILALALLACQCGSRAKRAILVVFPLALLGSTLAGSLLPPFGFLHLANLVVIVGLGGLIALDNRLDRLSPAAAGVAALLAGLILGYLCGIDMAASKVAHRFILGVALTGLLAVTLIAIWVPAASWRWGRTLIKLAGMCFAVAGMVLLVQLLCGGALPSVREVSMPGEKDVLPMLWEGELSLPLVVGALCAAMLWGAGHALTPGHGKAIVGAYLLGSRSTPWQALYLGLIVTATHTCGVFVLGFFTLFLSHYIFPEHLFPWLEVVSGLIVLGLGAAMFWRRVRPLLARHGIHHHHDFQPYGPDQAHDQAHHQMQGQAFSPDCETLHPHVHEHNHPHLPPGADGSLVSWRSLLGLGIWGGILPCPSAFLLLLAAVADNRVTLGIALVFAFSLGLAGVLTIVGLFFVKGSRFIQRLPQATVWGRFLPAASALVIMVVGGWLTAAALMNLRL
ncbi:MAG: HupE/UreJ family protein [Desulfobaccales bacterium]|jgi:ABC-type nickel/cobalt efflux system permease component RcnA/hydrogenase/urease accessory protein HupE